MLEIKSHQYLKKFLAKYDYEWEHIFAFGKIISRSLRVQDNCLINSEIFKTDKWYVALFISLLLNEKDVTLIISERKINFLKRNLFKKLREFGFNFSVIGNTINCSRYKIFLKSLSTINEEISIYSKDFHHSFIFTEVENIKKDLKKHLS